MKEELLWFISGGRNIRPLVQKNVHIWDEWPYQRYLKAQGLEEKLPKYTELWKGVMAEFIERIKTDESFARQWGDLGPVYGYQWRHWKRRDGGEIDQLAKVINTIKTNPTDRRMIVTAWNPEDTDVCALPPCHYTFQFQVSGDRLSCAMTQRSVDSFVGLPFNIASYALLTELMAKLTDLEPGRLTIFLGDTHLYLNHLPQAREQLKREPRQLPKLVLGSGINNLDNIPSEAINLEGYNPHPPIIAEISV